MDSSAFHLERISKTYSGGMDHVEALSDIDLHVEGEIHVHHETKSAALARVQGLVSDP